MFLHPIYSTENKSPFSFISVIFGYYSNSSIGLSMTKVTLRHLQSELAGVASFVFGKKEKKRDDVFQKKTIL